MLSNASQPHALERPRGCVPCRLEDPCFVAPSPELRDRLEKEAAKARGKGGGSLPASRRSRRSRGRWASTTALIIPPDEFPLGTPRPLIRAAAAERAPLRGAVRVIVVLVDFSDKAMTGDHAHFQDLFFSTGVLPHGSVKEYYPEVTDGLGRHHRRSRRAVPDAADARLVRQRQLRDNGPPVAGGTTRAATWPTTRRPRPTRRSTSRRTTTTATASSTRSSSSTPAAAARRPATATTSGRTSGRCRARYDDRRHARSSPT